MSVECGHVWQRRFVEVGGAMRWWDTRCRRCGLLYETGNGEPIDALPGAPEYLSRLNGAPPPARPA